MHGSLLARTSLLTAAGSPKADLQPREFLIENKSVGLEPARVGDRDLVADRWHQRAGDPQQFVVEIAAANRPCERRVVGVAERLEPLRIGRIAARQPARVVVR